MKNFTSFLFAVAVCASPVFSQAVSPEELINAARPGPSSPGLKEKIAATQGARNSAIVWGQDFLFIYDSPNPVSVSIDDQPAQPLQQVAGSNLWMLLTKMRTGVTHAYQFSSGGKNVGQRNDVVGYNPDSYPKPGVPKGKVSQKLTITSKLYDGMTSDYWVYASPGVDPNVPAPLMVWHDGQNLPGDYTRIRLFTVTENLVAQKLIPPMVHVMIAPGTLNGRAMRSVEYDTVSDKYARFLMEEVLPEVEKTYKLRPDAYSRAVAGESSGGISAFNVAWQMPDKFSRVHAWVASFTSIQWRPQDHQDGGNVYPFLVRKDPKKNLRVWLSDGSEDLENQFGSWPMQAIAMANSLKMKNYDFHFRFGTAVHGGAQAGLDLPESLAWVWRDYDPAKTSQTYEQEESEKQKPLFRVQISNRSAW